MNSAYSHHTYRCDEETCSPIDIPSSPLPCFSLPANPTFLYKFTDNGKPRIHDQSMSNEKQKEKVTHRSY